MSGNTNTTRLRFRTVGLLLSFAWLGSLASTTFAQPAGVEPVTKAGHPAEAAIDVFLGQPEFDMQQVFPRERFPNVAVAVDGTVLATIGQTSVRVRRSEDGGKTWGREIEIAKPGFQGGGLTVDDFSGNIFTFVESQHPPADIRVYRSTDHGKTWNAQAAVINKDSRGNVPSMHMNDHGITLLRGKFKGRLMRATRWYAGKNERARWPQHYTNAMFSDDGGKTWNTSDPFPAMGTGEATIAELSDGTIYYNSRRHWAEAGANPRRRWTASSHNGGATWKDLKIVEGLPDGPQDTNYGLMGGLVRLPILGRDILIFSNVESPKGRNHGTVWASFDGGKTWPLKRLVFEGGFAYSSLTAGRPKTSSDGWIYLHFEGGPKNGSTVARFNLSWLLAGQATNDGQLPKWLQAIQK
ncbi:MAG: sialidase family protein [Planctomycetota bacterium]|nr:sialidase family protein [Planctomycetota bacterium]